ncbi:MAG: OmpA family protein [Rhizobacter sp.]|nr:OmpA family protein [Ferruginibacter sp.]
MNKNKRIGILASVMALLLQAGNVNAQLVKEVGLRLKNRAKQNIIQKATAKVDRKISKTAEASGTNSNVEAGNSKGSVTSVNGNNVGYKSKFDFIPGEKILWYEDFTGNAVGDFPLQWNTNSTGEIVTIDGSATKWLKIGKNGLFMPRTINSLPENFTLQFDLMANKAFSYYSPELNIEFAALTNKKEYTQLEKFKPHNKNVVDLWLHPENAAATAGHSGFSIFEKGNEQSKNEINTSRFFSGKGPATVKVSIWRQQQRLRVYLDEEKIWDLPQAFNSVIKFNSLVFMLHSLHQKEDHYFLSNILFAAGAADTRHKLLNEGKFVTHGILFDDGSDKIKTASYGILKEIAAFLKENSNAKLKIVGHTDNNGDEQSNTELSKRRALAVKNSLCKDPGIDTGRIETDGKGEKEPADNNNTVTGKANNRRVEFVKL